jgi:hypothetical protein
MKIMVVWLLAMGFILGSSIHEAYVWHQIEQQAMVADMVDGAQK